MRHTGIQRPIETPRHGDTQKDRHSDRDTATKRYWQTPTTTQIDTGYKQTEIKRQRQRQRQRDRDRDKEGAADRAVL